MTKIGMAFLACAFVFGSFANADVPQGCKASSLTAQYSCTPLSDGTHAADISFENGKVTAGNGSMSESGTAYDCSDLADPIAKKAGVVVMGIVDQHGEQLRIEFLPLAQPGAVLMTDGSQDGVPSLKDFGSDTVFCTQK